MGAGVLINFRYHIISLVAVFLALGLGVALGSAFIDTAVVNRLEQNIETLSNQKNDLQAEVDRLDDELDALESLGDESGDLVLDQHLEDVPVFNLAVRGVDGDTVDDTATALTQADADYAGTLWLTERMALDDESEREDLTRVLALEPSLADDPEALRDAVVLRLGNAISDALRAEDPLDLPPSPDGEVDEGEDGDATFASEPSIITDLRAGGFVDYEPPEGESSDDGMQLPTAGARMVLFSGPDAVVPDDTIVMPLLRQLTASGPAPIVAAQSIDDDPPDGDEPSRVGFVGPVRNDDELRSGVSTVDDLELFIGRVATVLALEQSGDGLVGHYGLGEGADRVAPVLPED
jgi:hypothetical protein